MGGPFQAIIAQGRMIVHETMCEARKHESIILLDVSMDSYACVQGFDPGSNVRRSSLFTISDTEALSNADDRLPKPSNFHGKDGCKA